MSQDGTAGQPPYGQPQGQPYGQQPQYGPQPPYGQPRGATQAPPPPPKKKRRIWPWVLIGAVVMLLVLIGGCVAVVGKAASDVSSAFPSPVGASVDPSDQATDQPADDPTEEPTDDPTDEPQDSDTAKIGQTLEYTDGLEVTITKHRQSKISEYAAGGHPGDPLTIVTVKVKNGTKHNLDGDLVSVDLSYGSDGDPAESVFDNQVGQGVTGTIRKGSAKSGEYGFAVPKKHLKDVTVEVTADYDHDAAIFTGSVK